MSDQEVRDGLVYTKDHEWMAADGDARKVGVSAYAVDQLGDITLVNIDVEVGDEVEAGAAFGTVESVKTLSDLYAPVTGKVVAINERLEEEPELVNDEPYGEGWLISIAPSASADLMDAAAYSDYVANLDH